MGGDAPLFVEPLAQRLDLLRRVRELRPRHSERLLAHCARSSKRVGVLLLRDRLGGLGELSAEGRELRGVLRAEGVELRVCCLVRGVRERESKAGQ